MAWLSSWSHRKTITITGQSGAGTNYQVNLSIGDAAGGDFHLEGHCTSFPNDIQVTDNDQTTSLDYWVEDLTLDPITMWVEVADDLGTNKDICVYYDKSGASTQSNIGNTFPFGDDFPGSSLDGSKWTSSGTIEVADSTVTLNADDYIYGNTAFGYNYAVRTKAKADEQDTIFAMLRDTGIWNAAGSKDVSLLNSDYDYPNDFDKFLCRTFDGTAGTSTYIDNQLDFRNIYRIYEITRISGSIKYYQNDNYLTEVTTNLPICDLRAGLLVYDSSQASTLIADWVLIRKFLSPTEPAFSSAGSEETETAAIIGGSSMYAKLIGAGLI